VSSTGEHARTLALYQIVSKECRWLQRSDKVLFGGLLVQSKLLDLEAFPELADAMDAFVARFGRLQDTLGEKVLPLVFRLKAEPLGAMLDNLYRAERIGWIPSVELWMESRNMRNQMVHEYVEDPELLYASLVRAHELVPNLLNVADRFLEVLRGE